ncbi:hypothetical protein EHM76_05510, partial [bacterium]
MSSTKLAADTINAFRSGQELASSEPAELKKTIAELEARIREQNSLLGQKDDYIDAILQASKPVQEPSQVRQQPDYAELEKVKAQLRTVQRERDELKEKYRDTLRKLHSNSVVDPNEFL